MTDQELVELFWQRREEALTGLQDKYGGWCRSIAGRILGEERDVEECLGDCWLQLWNAIPPARPQHFRGYLGAVVRNRALLLRRRRGRQGDTVSLAALELAECLPSREGPEEQAEAAELGRAISAFLGELGRGRVPPSCGGTGTQTPWRRPPGTWAGRCPGPRASCFGRGRS